MQYSEKERNINKETLGSRTKENSELHQEPDIPGPFDAHDGHKIGAQSCHKITQ